ncbi:hypothetical protein Moror_9381 [Moniliophthora roreri MCA 2997]|uniref:Uncharacterized protein n=1 Tax=Moniliophthora roreri (strain MCA 2997) TaxID=1381753 RepID=V2X0T2_MONRO|nr:hypothetical protein Moror_9381 [Moniliophthora roreri MCA 2997]
MFNQSSGFSLTGDSTFNNVHGHQMNSTIHVRTVNFNTGMAVAKRTKRDEFRYVRCGDMTTTKEVHSEKLREWDWELQNGELVGRYKGSAQRTIYTVSLVNRKSKYTAMVYEGESARDFWKKDFRRFSRNKKPDSFQLFGINRSAIPALIFHHELIPCAHFFNKKSIWMDIYILHLVESMECNVNNLWMNTASGVLLSGPDGPSALGPVSDAVTSIVVPATVDMLKDNTCIRFFINCGSSADGSVLACARQNLESTYLDDLFLATAEGQSKDSDHRNWSSETHPYLRDLWQNPPDHLPMNVIGKLRFDTVYSLSMEAVARCPPGARSLWEWAQWNRKGVVEETVLDSGLTRFELDLARWEEVYLQASYGWAEFWLEWLSQSSRVFNAIDVTEGKENFFIADPPWLEIRSTRHPTVSRTLRNDEHLTEETPPTPIYLFLRPLPMSVSELVSWIEGRPYFWSLDKTGKSCMLDEECERWGLPVLTPSTEWSDDSVWLASWSTYIYTALQDWQKARGFDPTTSNWARELGYPEWEIVGTRKVQEEKKVGSSWWEAFAGSGITNRAKYVDPTQLQIFITRDVQFCCKWDTFEDEQTLRGQTVSGEESIVRCWPYGLSLSFRSVYTDMRFRFNAEPSQLSVTAQVVPCHFCFPAERQPKANVGFWAVL